MDNQVIFYTETGSGNQNILLIHGFCETHEIWKHILPFLNEKHRVFNIDLPGFGKSKSMDFNNLEEISKEIIAWIKSKNISEFALIGHSLGGYISLEIAKLIPNQITHLILFHSTALADSEEKKENRNRAIKIVEKHKILPPMDLFIRGLLNPESNKTNSSQINELIRLAKETKQETYVNYNLAMRDRKENLNVLQNNNFESLIIAGKHDPVIPLEDSISHKNSTSSLEILENSGHMGMIEEVKSSAKLILKFIQNKNVTSLR